MPRVDKEDISVTSRTGKHNQKLTFTKNAYYSLLASSEDAFGILNHLANYPSELFDSLHLGGVRTILTEPVNLVDEPSLAPNFRKNETVEHLLTQYQQATYVIHQCTRIISELCRVLDEYRGPAKQRDQPTPQASPLSLSSQPFSGFMDSPGSSLVDYHPGSSIPSSSLHLHPPTPPVNRFRPQTTDQTLHSPSVPAPRHPPRNIVVHPPTTPSSFPSILPPRFQSNAHFSISTPAPAVPPIYLNFQRVPETERVAQTPARSQTIVTPSIHQSYLSLDSPSHRQEGSKGFVFTPQFMFHDDPGGEVFEYQNQFFTTLQFPEEFDEHID
ncbi:hypothetical protein BLNAU_9185 [Blattamonas nauphoetae]|uniref:Uncharacterized protein n=1 Tax=Blattamonas nauphoetae TaxID=2049346 RepID=A0ABQ9XWI8_9EUKA|nr:hypothetical protein BLNAU_9185 [Blattamonas nauphoetae]